MEGSDPINSSAPNDAGSERTPPGRRLPPVPEGVERFFRDVARTADRLLDELDPIADRVAETIGLRKPPTPPGSSGPTV